MLLRVFLAACLLLCAAAHRPFQQTPDYIATAFRQTQKSQALEDGGLKWQFIGPDRSTAEFAASLGAGAVFTVEAGRVRGFLQDPNNLNRVFVLFGGGGLWRTGNFYDTPTGKPGATKWTPITNDLPANGGAISFGGSSNVLYYAIGDFYSSITPSNNPLTSVSGVIVKSVDGGDTWQAPVIIHPDVSIVWDLDVISGNARYGGDDTVLVGTDVGLFVSRDGAKTFSRVLPVNLDPQPNPVSNTSHFWCVMRTSVGWIASGQITKEGAASVFRSDDGVTWSSTAVFVFPTNIRVSLYQALRNNPMESVVLANVPASRNEWLDVFRSDDGGLNFTALGVLTPNKTFSGPKEVAGNRVLSCVGGQADYNQALLFDPSDSTRNTFIWAGAFGAFKTADNGNTLTLSTIWYPGWNECPNSGKIPYMHADAHAAIALERPPSVKSVPCFAGALQAATEGANVPFEGRTSGATTLPLVMPASSLAAARRSDRHGVSVQGTTAGHITHHGDHHHRHQHKRKHHDHDNYQKHVPNHYHFDNDNHNDNDNDNDDDQQHGEHGHGHNHYHPYPSAKVYDVLFGTDGGLFFSPANVSATPTVSGVCWDNGMLNIGLGTLLVTHVRGTPLNRNMVMIGTQDNGARLRIQNTTSWEAILGGDGQDQALSQAGNITTTGGYVGILNWYLVSIGLPFDHLDRIQRTNNFSGSDDSFIAKGLPDGKGDPLWIDGSFGIPDPDVDPTGQVFYTRTTTQVLRSSDGGRSFHPVFDFPVEASRVKASQEDEGEGDIYIERYTALHHIGVKAGSENGTMSLAVIRPERTDAVATNFIDITTNQGEGEGAKWTSTTTEDIPNWADERMPLNAVTTSPTWRGNRLFVSSVALPSPELNPPRPRIAFADVSDAGVAGPWSACPGQGLPDTPVQRILVDGNRIYAATWIGVYVSSDDCETFSVLGAGLPNAQVKDLYLLPAEGSSPKLLRAGTFGRSVWEVQLP